MIELLRAPGLWTAVVLLPMVIAAALFIPGPRRMALTLAPWAAAPILVLAVAAPLGTSVSMPWLLFDARFELDPLARVFASFSAIVWLLVGLSIRGELDDPASARRLHLFHLMAMSGNVGLIFAADLISFYSGFTLMSFAGYGLVIHKHHDEARRAARIYIVFTMIGELMLFAGIILAAAATTGLALADVPASVARSPHAGLTATLLFAGAGVKAGVLLLHMWLPPAHAVAPTPSSAALSSAMIEAGLFAWLRLLPLGFVGLRSLGAVVIGAGIVAAVYGVAVGVTQRDSKTILAYSSVSQMGLMAVAVGVGLRDAQAAPLAIAAAAVFAFHHGLSKAGLFLGVGVARRQLGRRARLLVAGVLVGLAASIAGAPLSSGALAKLGLQAAVEQLPHGWGERVSLLASLSSAATAALMLRFLVCLRAEAGRDARSVSAALCAPWAVSAALALAGAWLLAPTSPDAGALWSSAWPLVLGLGGYLGATVAGRRAGVGLPRIPAGDLVVPLAAALVVIAKLGRRARERLDARLPRAWPRALGAWTRAVLREFVAHERPSGWTAGIMLLAALLTIFALLMRA